MFSDSSKGTLDSNSSQSNRADISQLKDTSHPDTDRILDTQDTQADVDVVNQPNKDDALDEDEEEGDSEHCVICLHEIRDRTILPCAHDRLCFECIFVWCQQSRKCPLCNAHIGPYLIHNFRSNYDYSKYYLPPLASSPVLNMPLVRSPRNGRIIHRSTETVQWGRRTNTQTSQERADELELAISKRRWIYRHGLYALHVASNSHTRYRPAPTPAQFMASQDIVSRATIFIRRELRVWINLDIEFLTTFILSLMKSIDIRSESAVKLLAEFLDMDIPYYINEPEEPSRERFPNAEHFAHELYSFLRSPFKDLTAYDKAVKYGVPSDIPSPPDKLLSNRHERHWGAPSSHQAQAESSRCARREESHSPSRYYRKVSSSPKPSSAYDGLYHNRSQAILRPSPPSPRSRTSSPRRSRTRDDSSRHEYNKNYKGKGKTTRRTNRSTSRDRSRDQLKGDMWKSNQAGKHLRTNGIPEKRPRTVSLSPSRYKDEYLTATPHKLRRVGRNENNRGHGEDPPLPAALRDCAEKFPDMLEGKNRCLKGQMEHERRTSNPEPSRTDTHSVNEAISNKDISPVLISADHSADVPIHPNWGISIKGQAKLLAMGGEGGKIDNALSGFNRQTSLALEDPSNSATSQTKRRKPSELLHAHLFGNSAAVTRTTSISASDVCSPSAIAAHEAGANEKNVSSETGGKILNRDLTNLNETPPEPSSSDRPSRMSAREIMIRTRKKLANMRDDHSGTSFQCGVNNLLGKAPPSSSPNATPAGRLSERVRSYLLYQLEKEKGKVGDVHYGHDGSQIYLNSTAVSGFQGVEKAS